MAVRSSAQSRNLARKQRDKWKAKRIFSIERQLIKKDINEDVFNQVDFSQLNEISPITDIRSTHVYRLKASQSLIKDVVKDAINKQEIAR